MTEADPQEFERLGATRFARLPTWCGNDLDPGTPEGSGWDDWTIHPTTPDQNAIENMLDRQALEGRRILHVGIGNSSLAKRFHHRVGEIVGLTVAPHEAAVAASLSYPNYRVVTHNKYLGRPPGIDGPFDYIVDNNPSSYGCCWHHLGRMMDFYASALRDDGLLLTEQRGLKHIGQPRVQPARLAFRYADWKEIGAVFGLRAWRIRKLYGLSRSMSDVPDAGGFLQVVVRKFRRGLVRR